MTSLEKIASQEWINEQSKAFGDYFPNMSEDKRMNETLRQWGSLYVQANIVLLLRRIIERLDEP